MTNETPNRFIFSAYANSATATLEKPVKAFLSGAPSAALPVDGGSNSQTKENLRFHVESHDLMRIGRASATVLGERRGDHYVTLATCTIEHLNILDIITADRVVARVTSVYPVNRNPQEEQDTTRHRARFHVAGSHFHNLAIGGKLVPCKNNPEFESENGFSVKRAERHRGHLFTEILDEYSIPQLGKVYLGEIDKYNGKVILTMIRVQLGCPHTGTKSVGTACSNGTDD